MSVCWQNTCRAQRVRPPVEQMPRRVLSKKGRPHCILEGGGWILGCQAKLSDLLKRKSTGSFSCVHLSRGGGKTHRVRVPGRPFPGRRVCWTWTGVGHMGTQGSVHNDEHVDS